jgi:hypothetical protein
MTLGRRARVAAAAIAPVTVAGLVLIGCNCSGAAWTIEILTAVVFTMWVLAGRR